MIRRVLIATAMALCSLGTAAAQSPPCVSDCDNDGGVTIDELTSCILAALDGNRLADCVACDQSGDGGVDIIELIRGVSIALGVSLTIDGQCRIPGEGGLVPCPPGTTLRVERCADTACFNSGEAIDGGCVGADPQACYDEDGKFVYQTNDCRAFGATLVFNADVDPNPAEEVIYRAIEFGTASIAELEVSIDPFSEATVGIIFDLGPAGLDPAMVDELTDAVEDAGSMIDFGVLDLGSAVTAVQDEVQGEPEVDDLIVIIDLGCAGPGCFPFGFADLEGGGAALP